MSTYAIGDLQGCCDDCEQLLERVRFDPACDHLWLVGDLINRGPESLRTLRLVKSLGTAATVVLGNHDLHLLAAAHGVRKLSKSDTLTAILDAPDAAELLAWVRTRKLAHYEHGMLMVHAGVLPHWTVAATLEYAHEVETALRADNWDELLRHMYGNQPDRWTDGLQGWERLRVLINVFTRLRFCSADGQMEFDTTEGAAGAPAGFLPWFEVPGRASAETPIIFGHWSTLGLLMRPTLLGIDTGCVWGGRLSAVRLEDRALFQVDCREHRRPG
jgi:bis(5'-nucleosyl)-tetraphosphatase (symmetrical)